MEDNDDLFSPDGIDEQIDQHRPARSEPTPGDLLVHDLQQLARSEQQLDSHSLEHVWLQVQAKRKLAATSTQGNRREQHVLSQAKRPEIKIIGIKEKQAMEDNFADRRMNSSASLPQTQKRRSLSRVVGPVLVATVALIMVLSFTVFSGILRTAPVGTGKGPSAITGSPSQQQIAISHGTSVCSFRTDPKFVPNNLEPSNVLWTPYIAWSSQGEIAVTDYASVRAYSAQNCASAAFSQSSIHPAYGASWSPDGKKLLVGNAGDNTTYVLNSQGNIITHLSNSLPNGAWSSDSTKITFASMDPNSLNRIQSVDLSNGGKITTLATFSYNSNVAQLSLDGTLALVHQANATQGSKSFSLSIWDVTSGKKISDLASTINTDNDLGEALSPDGSQVAVSIPGTLQIYTTANGHLLASIADTSSANQVHMLAWSPNGKYLAESANALKIYDVSAKKLATTFGTVDAQHRVVKLAWAPDNTGIASTTMVLTADGVPANTHTIVNVWKLS